MSKLPSDVVNEVITKLTADDKTKQGVDSAKNNISSLGDTAKKTGEKMSGFVSEQTGRNLSQFNEKTEKGRQLLTAFGGAVGGAAGNVVYYTGTLSYVVGRFSALELAAMGVLAVIGGLAWAFTRASEEEEKAARTMKFHGETMKGLREEIKRVVEANRDQMDGYDAIGKATAKAKDLHEVYAVAFESYTKQLKSFDFQEHSVSEYNALKAVVERAKTLRDEAKKQYDFAVAEQGKYRDFQMGEQLEREKEAERQRQEREEVRKKAERRRRREQRIAEEEAAARAEMERQNRLFDQSMERSIQNGQRHTAAQKEFEARLTKDKLEAERKRTAIEKEEARKRAEARREEIEFQANLVRSAGGEMINIMQAIAQGQTDEAFKAAAANAAMKAAYHLLEAGVAALFFDQADVIRNLKAAAMYSAFAAAYGVGYAATKGGGGGGGAAVGESSAGASTTTPVERSERGAGQKIVVYVNGHWINTSPEYDRVFSDGVEGWQASQTPGRTQRKF